MFFAVCMRNPRALSNFACWYLTSGILLFLLLLSSFVLVTIIIIIIIVIIIIIITIIIIIIKTAQYVFALELTCIIINAMSQLVIMPRVTTR